MDDQRELDGIVEIVEHRVREHLQEWTRAQLERMVHEVLEERRAETRRLADRLTEVARHNKELDRILRGEKGSNGLAADVRSLREIEEARERRERYRALKEWGIIAGVISLIVADIWARIGPTP